jgi:predicted pyridoxine 5'-phosphate oxidase superfamily flavin-nucleotide-binding protein
MGYPSDIAFTPTVKAFQARRGSRKAYARMESTRGWSTAISDDLARFLSAATSVYIGTTNSDMQPYIQHRGGPPGFIRVLDEVRFGFADFRGNRQYITAGNLEDNPRAFLFIINYTTRTRVKIWGRASVVEWNLEWQDRHFPDGYDARPEQAIIFTVAAWDKNCNQHIPQLLPADDMAAAIAGYEAEIASLQSELASLRSARGG